jgi:hypothetical protein
MMTRFAIVMALLLPIQLCAAADDGSRNPLGCKDLGYNINMGVLEILPDVPGDGQALYFLFNKSANVVKFHHVLGDNSPYNAFLNHAIKPRSWSALALDVKEMRFLCSINGEVVNCEDYLNVCQYARSKFGLNNRGNYWIVESSPRNAAVSAVIHYGIIPR